MVGSICKNVMWYRKHFALPAGNINTSYYLSRIIMNVYSTSLRLLLGVLQIGKDRM